MRTINRSLIIFVLFSVYVYTNVAYSETHQPAALNNHAWEELPFTDGYGLLPKPVPYSKSEGAKMFTEGKNLCDNKCDTPFASKLGVADGATGFSNCQSRCIRPEYSFLDLNTGEVTLHKSDPKNQNLHYIGVIYQCVEYARKWWMKNKDITYGSIDSAYEIIYLTEGKNIRTGNTFPLGRSINGTARRPPKRGDLVIYYPDRDNPEWKHGHVAVVVATDLEAGSVSVAEENYDNIAWQEPSSYSRKIRLFEIGGRYTMLDVASTSNKNRDGGLISGWIYPFAKK